MKNTTGNTAMDGLKNGIGFVEAMFEALLDEQAEWAKNIEFKSLSSLPPRTKEEEVAMSWDESLML